jgi:hypothetical protein
LRPEWIDLKHVGTAAVVVRIDQNLEVIVQILAYIASQFARDDA